MKLLFQLYSIYVQLKFLLDHRQNIYECINLFYFYLIIFHTLINYCGEPVMFNPMKIFMWSKEKT